jgi:hypothetical protein
VETDRRFVYLRFAWVKEAAIFRVACHPGFVLTLRFAQLKEAVIVGDASTLLVGEV